MQKFLHLSTHYFNVWSQMRLMARDQVERLQITHPTSFYRNSEQKSGIQTSTIPTRTKAVEIPETTSKSHTRWNDSG